MATDKKPVMIYLSDDLETILSKECFERGLVKKYKDGTIKPALGTLVGQLLETIYLEKNTQPKTEDKTQPKTEVNDSLEKKFEELKKQFEDKEASIIEYSKQSAINALSTQIDDLKEELKNLREDIPSVAINAVNTQLDNLDRNLSGKIEKIEGGRDAANLTVTRLKTSTFNEINNLKNQVAVITEQITTHDEPRLSVGLLSRELAQINARLGEDKTITVVEDVPVLTPKEEPVTATTTITTNESTNGDKEQLELDISDGLTHQQMEKHSKYKIKTLYQYGNNGKTLDIKDNNGNIIERWEYSKTGKKGKWVKLLSN